MSAIESVRGYPAWAAWGPKALGLMSGVRSLL